MYCVRVTANDGDMGEQYLREFQDNEKTIPTVLTTSQKLSTGVDARNIRNIVLMRPINSMIEFKQIIGRGTRLFDGKEYFTIYDFVDAYHHFADPEWDGEPVEPEPKPEPKPGPEPGPEKPDDGETAEHERFQRIRVQLADGKERQIQHMVSTSFWSADGKPITAEEFLQALFGSLPEFFEDEAELRRIWSQPKTRTELLGRLAHAGYGKVELTRLQSLIDAEQSDLFDVLEYVAYAVPTLTRKTRVARAQVKIFSGLNPRQKEFLDFVLSKYIETGVEELAQEKLADLLKLKYHALTDAKQLLGSTEDIKTMFVGFQRHLYAGTTG